MNQNLRNSGIDIIGNVPWRTHFCQFYQTKKDLLDVLIPYFKAGLENNEFCMWVTSKPLGVEEAKEALREAFPDLDVYLEKGQIEIIPYTDWYVKEGVFDSDRILNGWVEKLNQALVNGYDGLRLTGNTFWLDKEDWNDFVDYEEDVDRVLSNYQMIALCTYCLDKCNAKEIIDVVVNHQFALIKRDGNWEQIESSKRKEAEKTLIQQSLQMKKAEHKQERTEEALHESEEQYRTLFKSMDEGFCIIEMLFDENEKSIDYVFVEVNPAFEGQTGLNNVVGKRVRELIPTNEEYWYEIYGKVALTGESVRFENRVEALHRWYEVYTYRIGQPKSWKVAIIFNDITERKQEEQKISRYNHILEGINRIFSIVVQAKTKEELGNVCLSVALKLTGSLIGFIGLVGDDGLLHDIAISEMGWNQCQMYDKTGHRFLKFNFEVNGLYGSVINNGKGFFANNPLSHPDSIGLPFGHPSVTSFLGVPLVLDGKTMGLIAVADREGGYSYEHLEELEAIAPAVMQALHRKKSEEALSEAYEELQMQSEELQTQSEELHEAYETLHESEERFHTMANAIPQLAWIAQPDGYIYWYNERWYAYTGTTPEQMEGWGWQSVHDPEVLPKVLEQWKASIATGQPFEMEFPLRGANGLYRQFLTRGFPLKDAQGVTLQWFGTNTDVTDCKKAEEILRESEARRKVAEAVEAERRRLFDVLETLPVMVCLLTSDYRVAFANRSFREKFGESNGRYCYDYCFGRTEPCEFCESYKVLETGQPHHWEVNSPDGSVIDAYDFPFTDVDGSPMILEMDIDITERRKSEEKIKILANSVESSNDAIITESLEGIIKSWNKGAEQVYGYSAEEITGQDVSILEPDNLKGR
jgi:PAS domain S-box-containing protein